MSKENCIITRMKVLVIGGSGDVGSLVLPFLAQQHQLRVFDLKAPIDPTWEYIAGNVNNLASIQTASSGMDALIYMAMGLKQFPDTPIADEIKTNIEVTISGLQRALSAAHHANIRSIIYTSSLSVYGWGTEIQHRYFAHEDLPPSPHDFYGWTKYLGEEICRCASTLWSLNINVLRLSWPRSIEAWQTETYRNRPTLKTSADDLARAFLSALEFQRGFQLFNISGDYQNKLMNMSKATELLQWQPQARSIQRAPIIDRDGMKRSIRRRLKQLKQAIMPAR